MFWGTEQGTRSLILNNTLIEFISSSRHLVSIFFEAGHLKDETSVFI